MRCTAVTRLDSQGLYWFEEPIAIQTISRAYAQLSRELTTPVQTLARISMDRAHCIRLCRSAPEDYGHARSHA